MKFKKYPVVSIVIPTYNREKMLERLLYSIKDSSYPKDKLDIIVINNNSSDNTTEIVSKIRLKLRLKLRIHTNKKNLLLGYARNKGIELAKGDLIFFIDDDNILEKDCIKNMVRFQINNRDGFLAPKMYYYNEPKREWKEYCSIHDLLFPFVPTIKEFLKIRNKKIPEYFPNAYMVSKEVATKFKVNDKQFKHNFFEVEQAILYQKKANLKCKIVQNAKLWHDVPYKKRLVTRTNENTIYDKAKSRVIFQRKYGGFLGQISYFTFILPSNIMLIIFLKQKKKGKLLNLYLKRVIRGYKEMIN